MTRTLLQIQREMEKLEKEAERVKTTEIAGVIERIKGAIDFYGLTAGDLFGGRAASSAKGKKKRTAMKQKQKTAKKAPSVARYKDKETGKTWTGHGKRPGWFVQAIANGAKPEDLAA